jgi:hypothetical protein
MTPESLVDFDENVAGGVIVAGDLGMGGAAAWTAAVRTISRR